MTLDRSRRTYLKRLGAVALVGSIAGCGGGGDESPTSTGTDEPSSTTTAPSETTATTTTTTTTTTDTSTATATDTPTETATDTPTTPTPTPTATPTPTPLPGPDDYLEFVPNYDGMQDMTGQSSVTVLVGEGGNLFEPPGITISTGTTVTWEWVGPNHNVVAVDGTFDSGAPKSSGTFEYTFDNAGGFPYYCEPHRALGMKGYVSVEQ